MRVAHILRRDHDHHIGGDLTQLYDSVEALRRTGVDAFASEVDQLDSAVDVIHVYNLQLPRELSRALRRARQIAPEAATVLSPIFWPLDSSAVRFERGESWLTRPVHWLGPRRRAEWLVNRQALRAVAAVLPNSHVEAARVTHHFRVSHSNRWRVVPNGIWTGRWKTDTAERRTTEEPLRIACIGRLEPQKNQRRLVEAVRHLASAELTLVGPPGEPKYARSVLQDLATLGKRGRWISKLEQPAIRELLSTIHVHALPSFRETPGLASMEAAAAGCAIVVTKEGSAEEYFGNLATYAEPRSTDAIGAAVEYAASHSNQPALRNLMRTYDWAHIGKRLVKAYEFVLKDA